MAYVVLVVDDDDDDLMLLASHIQECQLDVTFIYASNGIEATQKLTEGLHPNLIMVDAHMPQMDGYEFVVWLMDSQAWRHIPVIIWTGGLSDSEVTRYYRAGANSLMFKQDAMRNLDAFCQHWFKLVQLPQLVWEEHR